MEMKTLKLRENKHRADINFGEMAEKVGGDAQLGREVERRQRQRARRSSNMECEFLDSI
jgi:hypothetical protein